MSNYPIEDEYAHHITNQIVDYFRKRGFDVTSIPISRNVERREGYDWRYEIKGLNKVFMLQFKRPNPRDTNISWELDQVQHDNIADKPYIFYCLPKSNQREEMEVMIHRCLFKRASFPFVRILRPQMLRYCDGWGSFASKVLQCLYGIRLDISKRKDEDVFEDVEINFKEPIAIFGISLKDKKIKIFANEKIIKKSDHE
ncbi:hypothetical protein QVH35_11675 [Candidatus Nitrosotenuis chungbukensis]|uniref:hypothetical protein n=1 Tax=Candidatus Nitrosotenuis chungbukensis TaxID=1353246 RepID=UPI0005B29F95|nr:hypothetical protein [Candidatus Nitrosotenuis chungbukensis]WKT57925.1 hypothetical protein QVH35_11675 [Candidatus Nitrosotenuis chungbukensis]